MKHLYKFSLLLLAFLLPATALAHDFEVDGIYYNINGNEATVTYKGTYSSQYSNEYSGDVTIPSTVTYNGTTYSVTSIGNSAFYGCSGLTSITIPNSVTTIGQSAFYNCRSLTSITIPNSVNSIGSYAFYNTTWYNNQPDGLVYAGLVAYNYKGTMPSGTNIIIRDGTLGIAAYAFAWCESLTSLTIPNSITSIGDGAFNGCSGLTVIDIPSSVTSIGEYAFSRCDCLANIQVASDNPKYDSRNNCNAIIETATNTLIIGCMGTVIPNSVTSIGTSAFRECTGLTSIDIPNSVTTIGDAAFSSCSGLTSITVASSNTHYDSRNNCNAIIETTSNTLVAGCKNTIIPNSVTSIGDYAFYGCSGLTSIDIPNSVASIGNGAFEYCFSLAKVNIGNSVTTIGDVAFYNCIGLTSITIPNSVNSIGYGAFIYCNIQYINCLAFTPPTIEEYSFDGCYGATLYVPDITLDNYTVADYWKDFNEIVGIPYTFEVDGTSYHATTLSTASVMADDEGTLYCGDVVIPDSVTYEDQTFTVTAIDDNAFDGSFELTSITIPNSVEAIGEQAFQGCTGLTSVTIGSGVTSIGAKAFNYCNALETVKCLGTVPPVMESADCFSTAAYNRATLLVPRNSEATYAAADYWYKFAHIEGWGSAGRGDVNGDGIMNIADVTFLIDAILRGDHEGVYFESADLNINGRLDIGDVTSLIDELLNGN